MCCKEIPDMTSLHVVLHCAALKESTELNSWGKGTLDLEAGLWGNQDLQQVVAAVQRLRT